MQVRFYFDPVCPWCWLTSRWLDEEVAPHRGLDVDWRSISLKVRNEDRDLAPEYLAGLEWPHTLLRVVEAVRAGGLVDRVGDLYREYGRRIHHDKDRGWDPVEAVRAIGLDESLGAAARDDHWDEAVRLATKEAEGLAGRDVGTPIVAIEVDGEWRGFFGPVVAEVPRGQAALDLWDATATLIRVPGFYELKRTRDRRPQMPD